ncbi:MAG TPA: MFS transporter [Stellaceae bacterium]|nr:MFS transporter [Stellaceae bacterium]
MAASRRWLVLAVLFLARAAVAFQFQSVATLAPSLVADLGIDYARLGVLIGFYMLPGVVIAFPGGLLGQRYGDKPVVLCGMVLMTVGGVMTGATHLYAVAVAGRLIGGVGGVLVNVLLTKMAADWFVGREIGTAMAILVSSWPLGIGLALVLEPRLAALAGWPASLDATGIAAGAIAVLVAAIYRSPAASVAVPTALAPAGLSWRETGLVSLAGLVWSLFNVGFNMIFAFAPAMLVAGGQTPAQAGFATSLSTWTIVLSVPLGGVINDRLRAVTVLMTTSFAVIGVAMLVIPLGAALPLLAVVGLVGGLPAGAIMTLPAEVLRRESRGAGMGVFFTWYYVIMAILPPLAGGARDLSGLPGAPVVLGGIAEFLALAVIVLFRLCQAQARAVAGAGD